MTDSYIHGDQGFPPDLDPYNGGEAPPPPTGEEIVNLPPWEDRERFGYFTGFFETIRRVFVAPSTFFTAHPTRRGLLGPLSFAVVIGVLVSVLDWIWSLALDGLTASFVQDLERYRHFGNDAVLGGALERFFETAGVIASPLLALVAVLVSAALIHLGVMLITRDNRGFEGTLRAVCYGNAPTIIAIVPFCGGTIGLVWSLVVTILGVRELHGCGTGRAVLAVLLPTVVCCLGCFGLLAMFGLLAAAS